MSEILPVPSVGSRHISQQFFTGTRAAIDRVASLIVEHGLADKPDIAKTPAFQVIWLYGLKVVVRGGFLSKHYVPKDNLEVPSTVLTLPANKALAIVYDETNQAWGVHDLAGTIPAEKTVVALVKTGTDQVTEIKQVVLGSMYSRMFLVAHADLELVETTAQGLHKYDVYMNNQKVLSGVHPLFSLPRALNVRPINFAEHGTIYYSAWENHFVLLEAFETGPSALFVAQLEVVSGDPENGYVYNVKIGSNTLGQASPMAGIRQRIPGVRINPGTWGVVFYSGNAVQLWDTNESAQVYQCPNN